MANPTTATLTANTWTKVATNVSSCMVHILTNNRYSHSYRLTGEIAPTDLTDAVNIPDKFVEFGFSASSDVYIYSHDFAGKVRVDS